MAATFDVSVIAELVGLNKDQVFSDKGTDGTTPDMTTGIPTRILTTADADEALGIGSISTIACIIIRAIDYDLDIDLDFSSAFDADLTVNAGEIPAVITNPAGTVYIKNNGAGETPTYEVFIVGTA